MDRGKDLIIQPFYRAVRRPQSEFILIGLLLFLVITVAHGARIQQNWSQLHWEDQLFFDHARQAVDTAHNCWTQPSLWPGLYRPLTTNCYYFLGGHLFNHQIEYYHAINVLVYALNALLLYALVRRLLAPLYAALAMTLFASRSAHAEVVTNTAEFQVLAATTFALVALLCFVMAIEEHRWRFLPLVYLFMLLALLSKEAKIALIPLLPLYVWLFARPRRWSYLWGAFAATGGSIGFLLLLQRAMTTYQPTGFTYAIAPATILQNLAAHFWSFSNWLVQQDQDVVMPMAVQSMAEALPGQAILLLYLLFSLLLLTFHQHLPHSGRVFALGGLFFLLAVLPYSFFADRLFMRYGYFSHMGLAMTVAAATAWSVTWLRSAWPQGQPQRLTALAARWFRAA